MNLLTDDEKKYLPIEKDEYFKLVELKKYIPYKDIIDQLIQIEEVYPITLEEIKQIARMSGIMNMEKSRGYANYVLTKDYAEYHNWKKKE